MATTFSLLILFSGVKGAPDLASYGILAGCEKSLDMTVLCTTLHRILGGQKGTNMYRIPCDRMRHDAEAKNNIKRLLSVMYHLCCYF
jgi:hypothetical protein